MLSQSCYWSVVCSLVSGALQWRFWWVLKCIKDSIDKHSIDEDIIDKDSIDKDNIDKDSICIIKYHSRNESLHFRHFNNRITEPVGRGKVELQKRTSKCISGVALVSLNRLG